MNRRALFTLKARVKSAFSRPRRLGAVGKPAFAARRVRAFCEPPSLPGADSTSSKRGVTAGGEEVETVEKTEEEREFMWPMLQM